MTFEIPLLGLILTLIYVSITGIYPGGLIVPGYLALYADQPERLIGTFAASLLTVAVYKIASEKMILFGKRRFVFMILTGAIFAYLISILLPGFLPGSIDYRVIGWVIPGLIANNCERQGTLVTGGSLIILIIAVFFLSKLIMMLI